MGTIQALCVSEKKGTLKKPVHRALFRTEWGIVGDAHAGNWHRQVSFLGQEEIEAFRRRGADVRFGSFGENIAADGFCFRELPVGSRLRCGEVWFEITQIGKECHKSCAIRQQVGDCIMPREGVFARVLHGGWITVGDTLTLADGEAMPLDAAVITASDKGSRGERIDQSGPKVRAMLEEAGYLVSDLVVLPDEREDIEHKLREYADRGIGLIVTTGGTGFSVRDVTPEATLAVCDRLAPGIPEAMRALSMQVTHRAMLSRAQAGICKRSLIVNLPGSVKAVGECLGFVLPELKHGIAILRGDAGECGRS
ncbi:molybdopterin-binding protein [Selenomonas montiformis]|uniref:Molybdenum cofactor biosynthesis protein n=1 Tax=Selenomonas montiformis TaxID=2652285 RepID=A0A6I2UTU5_9FIRM|nr:MOSC domain-containing protein [Selenomonas montiformis]MSV25583.1 molybdenum cofactor biosynthesis protein [Selenomonas montiformis]